MLKSLTVRKGKDDLKRIDVPGQPISLDRSNAGGPHRAQRGELEKSNRHVRWAEWPLPEKILFEIRHSLESEGITCEAISLRGKEKLKSSAQKRAGAGFIREGKAGKKTWERIVAKKNPTRPLQGRLSLQKWRNRKPL